MCFERRDMLDMGDVKLHCYLLYCSGVRSGGIYFLKKRKAGTDRCDGTKANCTLPVAYPSYTVQPISSRYAQQQHT